MPAPLLCLHQYDTTTNIHKWRVPAHGEIKLHHSSSLEVFRPAMTKGYAWTLHRLLCTVNIIRATLVVRTTGSSMTEPPAHKARGSHIATAAVPPHFASLLCFMLHSSVLVCPFFSCAPQFTVFSSMDSATSFPSL